MYEGMDTECYYGRHNFKNGFCQNKGCTVDQNNIVHISGRRWFQRSAGNTYHKVTVTMPDKTVLESGQAYGYGDQYQDTALELIRQYFGDEKQYGERLTPYLTTKGFYPNMTVSDVNRQKDL
jgi:hypothetical protein